jgi:hypothetical protein
MHGENNIKNLPTCFYHCIYFGLGSSACVWRWVAINRNSEIYLTEISLHKNKISRDIADGYFDTQV